MQDTYEFNSTEIEVPALIAELMLAFVQTIPEAELTGPGRETRPHVTVLDGLQQGDPAVVQRALEGERPFTVRCGATFAFPAAAVGQAYDVVAVAIISAALVSLHRRLAARLAHVTAPWPYTPHATLAFVLPGCGPTYAGNRFLVGREISVDRIFFSSTTGQRVAIPL